MALASGDCPPSWQAGRRQPSGSHRKNFPPLGSGPAFRRPAIMLSTQTGHGLIVFAGWHKGNGAGKYPCLAGRASPPAG
jgi:hypothetical protein